MSINQVVVPQPHPVPIDKVNIALQLSAWLSVILLGVAGILWYEQSVGWRDFFATINKDDIQRYDDVMTGVWIACGFAVVLTLILLVWKRKQRV